MKIDAAGLPNVYHVAVGLYSGGSPEGDEGFASLKKLGIRTIISVDGARPDVELARKHQLRYVHLPIGYDGVKQEQALKIARAIRDLPGPIYLHCHHGKHRSPAAAAAAMICLDVQCSVKTAVNVMKQAGTDPRYSGLYASPAKLHPATREELDRVPAEFPQVAAVPGLARLMVEIDEHWDRIKLVRTAGWKTPRSHPDIDPPHEVLQLQEAYREAGRLPEGQAKHPEEFLRWLHDAADGARKLDERCDGQREQSLNLRNSFARWDLLALVAMQSIATCHNREENPRPGTAMRINAHETASLTAFPLLLQPAEFIGVRGKLPVNAIPRCGAFLSREAVDTANVIQEGLFDEFILPPPICDR